MKGLALREVGFKEKPEVRKFTPARNYDFYLITSRSLIPPGVAF